MLSEQDRLVEAMAKMEDPWLTSTRIAEVLRCTEHGYRVPSPLSATTVASRSRTIADVLLGRAAAQIYLGSGSAVHVRQYVALASIVAASLLQLSQVGISVEEAVALQVLNYAVMPRGFAATFSHRVFDLRARMDWASPRNRPMISGLAKLAEMVEGAPVLVEHMGGLGGSYERIVAGLRLGRDVQKELDAIIDDRWLELVEPEAALAPRMALVPIECLSISRAYPRATIRPHGIWRGAWLEMSRCASEPVVWDRIPASIGAWLDASVEAADGLMTEAAGGGRR